MRIPLLLVCACGSSTNTPNPVPDTGQVDSPLIAPTTIDVTCQDLTITTSSGSSTIKHALVDVGSPTANFMITFSQPVGQLDPVPTTCPSGATCSGMFGARLGSFVVRGGDFAADGRVIIVCGSSASYWGKVQVTN